MNILFSFSLGLLALWCVQVQAVDNWDLACQFMRNNPDLMDPIIKCDIDNYPERYTTISTLCLKNATGLDRKEHFMAICRDQQHLTDANIKIRNCKANYPELNGLRMKSEIREGRRKTRDCMKLLIRQRLRSTRSKREHNMSDTMRAVIETHRLTK